MTSAALLALWGLLALGAALTLRVAAQALGRAAASVAVLHGRARQGVRR